MMVVLCPIWSLVLVADLFSVTYCLVGLSSSRSYVPKVKGSKHFEFEFRITKCDFSDAGREQAVTSETSESHRKFVQGLANYCQD